MSCTKSKGSNLKYNFTYGGYKIVDVNLKQFIEKQKIFIESVLTTIDETIEKKIMEHKKKFSDKKLYDLIGNNISYSFSKLHEGVFTNYPLAKMNFDIICETYDKLKNGISDRYESVEALSCVKVVTEKTDSIISDLLIRPLGTS